MGEDEYDPPIILGRPFLNTIKVIVYIEIGEVHVYFPSKKVHRYFTDPNYIVEDSNIKDGWVDYEGEVTRSGDI